VRQQYANEWGYCGDEFEETDHFPPQLYIREARRLVGDRVFTQNMAMDKTPLGNLSIGMGCYNFDSHCEERYACADPTLCTLYDKPYVALQCGCNVPSPGVYQMPLWLLFPKRKQVNNLLVPVCASASHVGYATVRMEPQFMMLGHAAGVVAALTVNASAVSAVQDVDPAAVAAVLLADGQKLAPMPAPPTYGCTTGDDDAKRCLLYSPVHGGTDANCSGKCAPLAEHEWMALRAHFFPPSPGPSPVLRSRQSTVLKKSEVISGNLPAWAKQAVGQPGGADGITLQLSREAEVFDVEYYIVACAQANCSAPRR